MFFRFSTVMLASLLTLPVAVAEELELRLNGTWILSGVEVQDESGNWVLRDLASVGMLIYTIEGPMSGNAKTTPATATTTTAPSSTSGTPERAMMTLGDGQTRLLWVKGTRN